MIKKLNKLWNNYIFHLQIPGVISNKLLSVAVNNFWSEVVTKKVKKKQHLLVIVRIVSINNCQNTIGKVVSLNATEQDKSYFINLLINSLLRIELANHNEFSNIIQIVFEYGIKKGLVSYKPSDPLTEGKSITGSYSHFKIPNSLDPSDYGKIVNHTKLGPNEDFYLIFHDTRNIAINKKETDTEIINKVQVSKNGILILGYTDKYVKDNPDGIFHRDLGSRKYYISLKNPKNNLFYQVKKTAFIPKLKPINKLNKEKIITLNIETVKINSSSIKNIAPNYANVKEGFTLVPYLISYYDGSTTKSFFLSDFDYNPNLMIQACISSLLDIKYKSYKIYVHNLAELNSYFLLSNLAQLCEIKPVFKGKLISISANKTLEAKGSKVINTIKKEKISLTFFDSDQILLTSLRNLPKSFNDNFEQNLLEKKLGLHELIYKEINKNGLNYINKFKDEAILYCEQDCKFLYFVITKFRSIIFNLFKVDITRYNYPTIANITYAIFRNNFLPENKIPSTLGQVFLDIKESYTGDSVDMYIPSNIYEKNTVDIIKPLKKSGLRVLASCLATSPASFGLGSRPTTISNKLPLASLNLIRANNDRIYNYYVNNIYADIMAKYDFPCGKIIYFEGDCTFYYPDRLGFFYCKVNCPENIEHPILQIKMGTKTIAPTGTFYGMFYSEELKNAVKFGYTYEILRGYIFTDRINPFKDYINKLYQFAKHQPIVVAQKALEPTNTATDFTKEEPLNFTVKIILNSLSEQFNLDLAYNKFYILNNKEKDDLLFLSNEYRLSKINNFIELRTDIKGQKPLYLIYENGYNDYHFTETYNKSSFINIAIHYAIKALARIEMSKFKNNPLIKLYYSDTVGLCPSIFINLNPDQLNELFKDKYPQGIVYNKDGQEPLGLLKLTNEISKAVFLAPNCYWLEMTDGTRKVKIKNVKSTFIEKAIDEGILSFDKFESLLNKDNSIILNQEKWNRNLNEANITILDTKYELKQNDNKRELVYDENGKCVNTKPININTPIIP